MSSRDKMWSWLYAHGLADVEKHPCWKCRYWEPWPEDVQDEFGMVGNCLRYPPMLVSTFGNELWDFSQPVTGCMATCGEWRKRKKAKK